MRSHYHIRLSVFSRSGKHYTQFMLPTRARIAYKYSHEWFFGFFFFRIQLSENLTNLHGAGIMKETYKTCEDCTFWQPNNRAKTVGVCLIDMRPDILKWRCLSACQKFSELTRSTSATRKDPVQDRII